MSAGSNKFTIEYVRKTIEDRKCLLLSEKYVSSKNKLKIQFECGHIDYISFECFKRGQGCSCQRIEKFKSSVEQKTRKKILDVLDSKGYELISFENNICSWDNNFTYKCSCGNIEVRGIREFMRNKICLNCSKAKQSDLQRGEKGSNWQGGKTELSTFIQRYLTDWKKESMKHCDYKCVITGDRFDDIHHLYPLNKIIEKYLKDLKLKSKKLAGSYSEEDRFKILEKVIEFHSLNLGVCLRKDVHQLFHKMYGNKDVTPKDFYDFSNKISQGNIHILKNNIGEK